MSWSIGMGWPCSDGLQGLLLSTFRHMSLSASSMYEETSLTAASLVSGIAFRIGQDFFD